MIRVLIVDDSITIRTLLRELIGLDTQLKIVGEATNGVEAIELVEKLKPDVISMDIGMPIMDGLEATRIIMERMPTPLVILSGLVSKEESKLVFDALDAGALKVLNKTEGPEELNRILKLISGVKVVRRRPPKKRQPDGAVSTGGTGTARDVSAPLRGHPKVRTVGSEVKAPNNERIGSSEARIKVEIIAIGASTGGPAVISDILSTLPATLPAPILVVQHITQGFIDGFAHWLNESCNLHVKLARNNEILLPGVVYLAPDDYHLKVNSSRIRLSQDEPHKFHRPSATILFQSVAEVYKNRAMGILLTGMGNDGAYGLKSLRYAGAYTIAQDKDSSVIFGMPMEAIKLNAADKVLSPEEITIEIQRLCQSSSKLAQKDSAKK